MEIPWVFFLYYIHFVNEYIVLVLGRDKGYIVKYSPLPEKTLNDKGLYFTFYPELLLDTNIM